jgi:hypothetical protein
MSWSGPHLCADGLLAMKRLLLAIALLTLAGCTQVDPQTGMTQPTVLGDAGILFGAFVEGFAGVRPTPSYVPPPQQTICQPRGDGSYQCQ